MDWGPWSLPKLIFPRWQAARWAQDPAGAQVRRPSAACWACSVMRAVARCSECIRNGAETSKQANSLVERDFVDHPGSAGQGGVARNNGPPGRRQRRPLGMRSGDPSPHGRRGRSPWRCRPCGRMGWRVGGGRHLDRTSGRQVGPSSGDAVADHGEPDAHDQADPHQAAPEVRSPQRRM